MKESNLIKTFLPEWQKENGKDSYLCRNNTGSAYQGQVISEGADFITIKRPRFITFGVGLIKKIKGIKVFLKVGAKIDECKRHLFNQGYSYDDDRNYVKLVFEKTGLKFGLFDYVEKEEIKNAHASAINSQRNFMMDCPIDIEDCNCEICENDIT